MKIRLFKIMQHTVAGEVKVLPNQTHEKLKQQDMERNLSHSANRYELLLFLSTMPWSCMGRGRGSGCKAPYILTPALDGTWYLPSRSRRFNHPPPTKVYPIKHIGLTAGPRVGLRKTTIKKIPAYA